MSQRARISLQLAFTMAFLAPVALAQKPPAPPPPPSNPPPTSPGQPTNSGLPGSQPAGLDADFVMFLAGKVATDDGTQLPNNVMIERVCNARVRQQVYANPGGDFTMQLGSLIDSALDASADGNSQSAVPGKFAETGIPRQELEKCEVRASISGFQSRDVSLVALDASSKSVDVGIIVVHRSAKIQGATVNAAAYKAPKDAVSAYVKGLDAQRNGKFANARKYFEKAVEIYPAYVYAWFQLGTLLEKANDKDAARTAYTRATTVDARFLPPYLSLASMAFEAGNWMEVIHFTDSILALDPFKDLTGYTMELDPFSYAEAYFYNAAANYNVHNFADAERNALKAEHLFGRSPQLHFLLGQIFARKNDYANAILELQIYLELVPHAKDADWVGEQLAKLQTLNNAASTKQ
ncbi:MAG TPA: tetratricopeptide repeat protein [Candidatus Acidoferrum sp.]|nr:tetratricopeptide repeat protein [Candidatus Acidoferrum sp.]